MTTVQIQAMQWGEIPYMGSPELVPFSDDDTECFREIRDVLKRHNALQRFGVFLIHKHFDIAEDEEMTECTDHEERKLTIIPRKKADIDPEVTVPTNWIFTDTEQVAAACCECARNSGGHQGHHR
ncbi:hypothetical protein [Pseudomonas fluorescens]|uniref:Uncharacterized protein n=1 Tax=Pseudomonas fluorescens TaxID=294 RepID=A0A5E7AM39_PSEFL|nr:hypothetical protein [Pseudomonas fluorescens]VVN79575.1 hypothetical protein PS691_00985 [Pseudomonas fluorescens]